MKLVQEYSVNAHLGSQSKEGEGERGRMTRTKVLVALFLETPEHVTLIL